MALSYAEAPTSYCTPSVPWWQPQAHSAQPQCTVGTGAIGSRRADAAWAHLLAQVLLRSCKQLDAMCACETSQHRNILRHDERRALETLCCQASAISKSIGHLRKHRPSPAASAIYSLEAPLRKAQPAPSTGYQPPNPGHLFDSPPFSTTINDQKH
uniref:Uncharacterized protein n=1 Tax=Eutreptiella gymnastica TaxID=73025 RepID=A0A7S4GK21_9EUGL